MQVTVMYHQSGGRGGRWYAARSLSMQALPRKVRHTAAHGHMVDVDMVNTAPNLLLQICLQAGFACPRLEEYVQETKRCCLAAAKQPRRFTCPS